MKFSLFALVTAAAGIAAAQGLPGEALGIVQQTDLARKAVADHNKTEALAHIRQARALADDIQKQSPPEALPILITIAREVETTSTFTDVKHSNVGDLTASRLKKNSHISGAQADITATKLNVTTAADRLPAAEAALDRDDWAAADVALADVQNAVVRVNVQDDLPLLRAKQNLELARARVLEDKYKDARMPLQAAAQALADFETASPGPEAVQAEYMRQQIQQFAAHVGERPADAVERIDSWLDPVQHWYQAVLNK
jgi:hypothetical protein